jgi:hypothetical protein
MNQNQVDALNSEGLTPESYVNYKMNELAEGIRRATQMAKERQPIPGHVYLAHIGALTDQLLALHQAKSKPPVELKTWGADPSQNSSF